jgi:hypothetical protein
MNLENKLEYLPPVYYINLDHRVDRREYIESQFDYWSIKNYKRISASKYLPEKYKEWKDIVIEKEILECKSLMSCALNHIETIVNWYDRNSSKTCIIMEDDLSLHNIEYWNFDWDYFQNNLPENWECIQLYFCRTDYVPMFLHKREYNTSYSAACYLINRSYAKKVKDLMYFDGKYKLTLKDGSYQKKYEKTDIIADANLFDIGITYSIPLFSLNVDITNDSEQNIFGTNPIDVKSTNLINNWWKNEHHKFSLEDFFTYGKPNDHKMTKQVKLDSLNSKIYYN